MERMPQRWFSALTRRWRRTHLDPKGGLLTAGCGIVEALAPSLHSALPGDQLGWTTDSRRGNLAPS